MMLDYILAVTAFITVLISLYENGKIVWNTKSVSLTIVAVIVLAVTSIKIYNDDSDAKTTQSQNLSLIKKVDTLQIYIKRVDSLGIKRDKRTNMPIIKTLIDNSKNVKSENQHGGQTGFDITNNK